MESKNLSINNWKKFKNIQENNIPGKKGLYVLRLNERFGRLKGSSDILYIGWSENLRHRLWDNYKTGTGGGTTQRVHNYLKKKDYSERVEIGWEVGVPRDKEKRLLKQYEQEHHELPPWNRQR